MSGGLLLQNLMPLDVQVFSLEKCHGDMIISFR